MELMPMGSQGTGASWTTLRSNTSILTRVELGFRRGGLDDSNGASLCWMTGPPGVAVGCLGLPSLQHPLGELQATAGVVPAAGDAVVLAGEVVVAGEVLPPTMGVGVAADDVVEDAGVVLLLVEFAPPPN